MSTPMTGGESGSLEELKIEIRKVAHDLSNPLGILRMAVYFLETAKPDAEKQAEYYTMMNQNIDKAEVLIRRLRQAAGSPSVSDPPPETVR